jgi:plastocyanin
VPRPTGSAGRSGLLAIVVGASLALAACSGAASTAAPASAPASASAPAPVASPSAEASIAAPVASAAASTKPGGGRYGSGGASSPTPAAAASAGNAVTVVDFGFNPDTIKVKVGTTVTWTNTGVTHTVTADKGLFDSGMFKSGETFSFTFAKGGTFTYHCAIHSSMRGTVTVTP